MKIIFLILIGYIMGSFSSSYVLGRMLKNEDIRDHGSGNAGTTNALRVFGKKIGVLTLIMDMTKGILAVLIGRWLMGENGALLAGVFVVIGHNWPVFLGFKGGKGIATSFGVLLMFHWQIGLVALGVFIIIIALTRYVSLGSICASVIAPIVLVIIDRSASKFLYMAIFFLGFLSIVRHRENIKRLIKGNENKLGNKKDRCSK